MISYRKQHALSFEGGYVEVGAGADFDLTSAFSFAAWICPSSGSGPQATILSKGYQAYEPQVQNGVLVFERGPEYAGASPVAMGAWVHVAVTFDAAAPSQNLKLYLNGTLDAAFDVSAPLATTDLPLYLGTRPGGATAGDFRGLMGDVALWKTARSAWQLNQDLNAGPNAADPDLVAYWPMEETGGTAVPDAGPGGHAGTFNGALSWVALDAPIVVNPRPRTLRVDTSINRLVETADRARDTGGRFLTLAATAPAVHDGAAPLATEQQPLLPPSGRNGEAQKLLHRVQLYNQQRVQQGQLDANAQVQQAKSAAADQVQAAQREAARQINSTRFDTLFFIHDGAIHTMDAKGTMAAFGVADGAPVRRQVDSIQKWQKTGVTVKPGERVLVRPVGGSWTVNPGVGTCDASGHAGFVAKDGYALPGANEGALVGRLGGQVFLVGGGALSPEGATGELELVANDDLDGRYGAGFADNGTYTGAYTANVTITNGTPNTAYGFNLKCVAGLGTVQTDGNGRGTASFTFSTGSVFAFDSYPDGAPSGNKFQSTQVNVDANAGASMLTVALVRLDQIDDCENGAVRADGSTGAVVGSVDVLRQTTSGALTVELALQRQPVETLAADLAVDPVRQRVFWAQATSPFSLHAANFDGSGHQQLADSPDLPITSVALDETNQRVFYLAGTGAIFSAGYDGGGRRQVLDVSGPAREHFWQIDVDDDNGRVYWTNDFSIWSAKLDGTDARPVVAAHEAPFPLDLAVDGEDGKLYWIDKELGVVRRSGLDGANPEDLYAVPHPIRGITLDEVTPDSGLSKEVYWSGWEEAITAQTPGIGGYWPLDAGHGETLRESLERFPERPLGAVHRVRDDLPEPLRVPDAALLFDGPADFVALPQDYVARFIGKGFTVELWVKPDSVPGTDVPLLAMSGAGAESKVLHLLLRGGKPFMGFFANDTQGTTTIKAGTWTHLAFRYDASTQEQALFVNGVLDTATTGHAPLAADPATLTFLGHWGTAYFTGQMAGLHVAERALTEAEIRSGLTQRKPGDLLPSLRLGPAWAHGDVPPLIRPPHAALAFDGRTDYVPLGTSRALGLLGGSFTVECWLKADDGSLAGLDRPVLGMDIVKQEKGQVLHLILRNGVPYMGFWGDDLQAPAPLEAGAWHHVAWRFNAGTKEQAIFVDGARVAGRTAEGPVVGDGPVYLGRYNDTAFFSGMLSDLRVWNVARTDAQIADNRRSYRASYALRGPVDGSGPVEHLFEIPSSGGLALVSRLSADHEQRLLAYRAREEAQKKAAADVDAAHAAYTAQVDAKGQELEKTHQEQAAAIDAKKAEHEDDRTANRTRYAQAQQDASRRIDGANQAAAQKRAAAQAQAAQTVQNANVSADQMKNQARQNVDAAQQARDKYN